MHRVVRTAEKKVSRGRKVSIPVPEGAPKEAAAFAAKVRALTNYEVWKRVEAMKDSFTPGRETENKDWWRFQILVDELQWRLSGLEGPGTAVERARLVA